jgi:hypothetical protein
LKIRSKEKDNFDNGKLKKLLRHKQHISKKLTLDNNLKDKLICIHPGDLINHFNTYTLYPEEKNRLNKKNKEKHLYKINNLEIDKRHTSAKKTEIKRNRKNCIERHTHHFIESEIDLHTRYKNRKKYTLDNQRHSLDTGLLKGLSTESLEKKRKKSYFKR